LEGERKRLRRQQEAGRGGGDLSKGNIEKDSRPREVGADREKTLPKKTGHELAETEQKSERMRNDGYLAGIKRGGRVVRSRD